MPRRRFRDHRFGGVQIGRTQGIRLNDVATVPDNLLLGALAPPDRNALISGTEPVVLSTGDSLAEAGKRLAHVYFPIDSSISVAVPVAGHPPLEVGLIGYEGMLGIPLVLGASTSAFRAVVQGGGRAWRVDAGRFTRQLEDNRQIRRRMNAYAHVLLMQMAQAAACKNFHVVEERLARWLLMSRDRARCDRISLTHEILSQLLGVRRAGVTLAANALQKRALISYARGQIVLLDTRGLEAAACGCYSGEKRTYSRFMS